MVNLVSKDWKFENIDTILFDKDGTFIDLHYFWGKMTEMRATAIINQYSLNPETFAKLCLFLGYDLEAKKMLPDGITALYSRSKIIEIFTENLKEIGVLADEDGVAKIFDDVSEVFYKTIMDYTKPITEAINFIKNAYNKGLKLGIVTSDSVVSTKLTLKHFGWERYFDVVIGRESSTETKESGIPTKMALSELKANPETAVMIGDAPMDYISAKNAGINNVILVSTGQIAANELQKTCEYVLDSLSQLGIL